MPSSSVFGRLDWIVSSANNTIDQTTGKDSRRTTAYAAIQKHSRELMMPLADIDFRNIRLHKGSQDKAFEELCCQIAALEDRPTGATHFRKGPGADAGVECFTRFADGSETGWQVKYYQAMDSNLTGSLDDSIASALEKHPKLRTYVVCIPFDLSDSRKGKAKTPLQRWDEWREKWLNKANALGRTLNIELWSESVIKERLGREDPQYSGRVLYWFDTEVLTPQWFQEKFARAKADLGPRYTPETNVEVPLRRDLSAFVRDPSLKRAVAIWLDNIRETGSKTVRACVSLASLPDITDEMPTNLEGVLSLLEDQLAQWSGGLEKTIPVAAWVQALSEAQAALGNLWGWAAQQNPKREPNAAIDVAEFARHELRRLAILLEDVADELQSSSWSLPNFQTLLVYGEAGCGKSHTLADAVDYQLGHERPALLFLANKFNDSEPWQQILEELDLPRHYQIKHLLGALDAAAEAADSRALLVLDALNEHHGPDIWPRRLAGFLSEISAFPRIAIALTCRTTYIRWVIPDGLRSDVLPRIKHPGFTTEAAFRYLEARGFTLPGMPNLMPELTNPLFLRTCCDALEIRGEREFPRGLRGVTAIYDFYFKAVEAAVNQRLRLDPRRQYVRRVIEALVEKFIEVGIGYLPSQDAIDLIDSVRPSNGEREKDLLFQLESEGLLTIEISNEHGEDRTEEIRFTFERFSDHAIATALLDNHLDRKKPETSFAKGTALHDVVVGALSYSYALGVAEAIAVQLPERVGRELPDMFPEESPGWIAIQAFFDSLLWRNQGAFTARTLELIQEYRGSESVMSALIAVSSEPDNQFNARYLHEWLFSMPMPKRDAVWSAFIAESGERDDGSVRVLINWALGQGFGRIDDDRAELAALAICWMLSTTNRHVRDRATKALVALLATRVNLAASLIERFVQVDDGYVLERVLAATYGAIMQGAANKEVLEELATVIYRKIFAKSKPPLNILIRDHARGIVEYAAWRGCDFQPKDMRKRVQPPHISQPPEGYVPDEVIEAYTEDYGKGARLRDRITSSTVGDGDFARYVLDRSIQDWSPAPIGTTVLPTSEEIRQQWEADFLATASDVAKEACDKLKVAAKVASGEPVWSKSDKARALNDAEMVFSEAVSSEVWADYRLHAQDWTRHGMYQRWPGNDRRPASINLAWARRWVCRRAHQLGWSSELHGEFDRFVAGGDRTDHRIERIGKKYQWLALYDLRARLADNHAMLPQWDESMPRVYEGEWQDGLRDIDPSLLVLKTSDDGWTSWDEPTWWMPIVPKLKSLHPLERLQWRDSDEDRIDSPALIEVTDPTSGTNWLTLHTHQAWRQWAVCDGHKNLERDTWCRVNCVVVRKRDKTHLLKALQGRRLTDPSALPKISLSSGRNYIGEYPWHPAFEDLEDWIEPNDPWLKVPVPVRPTVTDYMCERGNYDYSIDQTVNVCLPAPWLIDALGLRLSNGRRLTYVDGLRNELFFDPSVKLPGPQAALVDRNAFLELLERNGLSVVWVIAGEKGVFGGHSAGSGFGGRQVFTSLYHFEKGKLKSTHYQEQDLPLREQLLEMFGDDPVPPWAETRG